MNIVINALLVMAVLALVYTQKITWPEALIGIGLIIAPSGVAAANKTVMMMRKK